MNSTGESQSLSESNHLENAAGSGPSAKNHIDEDPSRPGPSRIQKADDVNDKAPAEKPKRKRKRKCVYNPAGGSKSLRRIKRLGYTPEQNKKGYKYTKKGQSSREAAATTIPLEDEAEARPSDAAPDGKIVKVDAPHGRAQGKKRSRAASNKDPARRGYTYIRVNGKSVRYLDETEQEMMERRAKYIKRNMKYKENETEEQHEERLERRRARCREKYAQKRKALEALAGPKVPKVRKPRIRVRPPKKPRVAVDLEQLTGIQREYAEFKLYVAEKLQEARAKQRQQLGNTPQALKEIKSRKRVHQKPMITSPQMTPQHDRKSRKPKEAAPSTVLLANDIPVDLEIALLETSDQTFVPVQVICQTCDDFDDMLEIENV